MQLDHMLIESWGLDSGLYWSLDSVSGPQVLIRGRISKLKCGPCPHHGIRPIAPPAYFCPESSDDLPYILDGRHHLHARLTRWRSTAARRAVRWIGGLANQVTTKCPYEGSLTVVPGMYTCTGLSSAGPLPPSRACLICSESSLLADWSRSVIV